MAKYDYRCRECETYYEIERSIHDPESDLACPVCTSTLTRVYGPVGVVLKGDGFYRTDSQPKNTNFYPENGATF